MPMNRWVEPSLTKKAALERYKGARGLKIELHPDYPDRVIRVSYKPPCVACGKYHYNGSKAQKRCTFKLIRQLVCCFNEINKED